MPAQETAPATSTLRRNPIRDSIRVAKGRPRPTPGKRFASADTPPVPEVPKESLDLAADAPHVPRFSHGRKRSNTTPRPAFHALRSISSQGTMPSSHGTVSPEPSLSVMATMPPSRRSSVSRRMSEASGAPSANSNMFDMGTVRMEAFIDHHSEQMNRPRPPPRQRHIRKTSSQWSERRYEFDTPSMADSEVSSFRPDTSDPFREF